MCPPCSELIPLIPSASTHKNTHKHTKTFDTEQSKQASTEPYFFETEVWFRIVAQALIWTLGPSHMQESCICSKLIFCFPFDVWILFSSCLSLHKKLGLESASPITFSAQVKKKKSKNKHKKGALWVPIRSQPQSWSRGGKQRGCVDFRVLLLWAFQ